MDLLEIMFTMYNLDDTYYKYVRRIQLNAGVNFIDVYGGSKVMFSDSSSVKSIMTNGEELIHTFWFLQRYSVRIPSPKRKVRIEVTRNCECVIILKLNKAAHFTDPHYENELFLFMKTTSQYDFMDRQHKTFHLVRHLLPECYHLKSIRFYNTVLPRDASLIEQIRQLLPQMPWLESFKITTTGTETFELFEHLPKEFMISSSQQLVIFPSERLRGVERLSLEGVECLPDAVENLRQNLRHLELKYTGLSFDIFSLRNLTSLSLCHISLLTFQHTVEISRLLRKNRLKSLSIIDCSQLRKADVCRILLPLVDGSNTTLEELELSSNLMTTHVSYMLEEVVSFSPMLRRFSTDAYSSKRVYDAIVVRNEASGTLQTIKRALGFTNSSTNPDLEHALHITARVFAVFAPVYTHKKRVWRRSGLKEVVPTFVEMDLI